MHKNRLAIYFLSEEYGRTDEYINYMLEAIKKYAQKVVIISNTLEENEKKAFSNVADEFYKTDAESSFVAYYNALTDIKNKNEYDEIIFLNSNIFGPLYEMTFIDEPQNKLADFYGLKQDIWMSNLDGKGSNPLNPDFFVLKNNIICDDEFLNSWAEGLKLDNIDKDGKELDFDLQVIGKVITEYLLKNQYVYAPFVKKINQGTYIGDTKGITVEGGYPVVSKENIVNDYDIVLDNSRGEEAKGILEYIKNNTKYPYEYLISHIIKASNTYDIYNALKLNYILPSNVSNNIDKVLGDKKAVIVVHIFYMDLIQYFSRYILDIPKEIDVILTTTDSEKGEILEKTFRPVLGDRLKVIVSVGAGRELAALLVEARDIIKDYDYICFTHDKKSPHNNNQSVSRDFQELIVENVLDTGKYITNIIEAFNNDYNLGLLVPPQPLHGGYFASLGRRWTVNVDVVNDLLETLNINAQVDEKKPPLATGSSFWCRKEALQPLLDKAWSHEDFVPEPMPSDGTISHGLERSFAFIAQSQGFYTGMVMTINNASIEYTNREYLLEKLHYSFHQLLPTFGQNISRYTAKIDEYIEENVKDESPFENGFVAFLKKCKAWVNRRLVARFIDKKRIEIIRNSKLFDGDWYLKNYEAVARENFDPAIHYYMFGWKEGKSTSKYFSAEDYYRLNPDVKKAKVCPLYHWETSGKFEGRDYTDDPEKLIDIEITDKEWKNFNKKINRTIKREKKIGKHCSVKKNKIVFRTFQQEYTCNPKYICDEIIRRDLPYDLVWLSKNSPKALENFPKQVRVVKDGTIEAKKEIASAKVLIDNGIHFYNFKELKKKKQVSICTWHGSLGFKKLAGNAVASKRNHRSALLYDATNDLVISDSTFEDDVFRKSYWQTTEFIECGHPRNDILIKNDVNKNKEIRLKVCKKLGIDYDNKIALYAPTFREKNVETDSQTEYEEVDFEKLKSALEKKFGGSWVIIIRAHFVNAAMGISNNELPEYCYNGTRYSDIQELMVAADMALTDYSSWILDYMFTRKPAFLYTPDYNDYELQRGFCYPLSEAPFLIAETNGKLAENIAQFDEEKYKARIEEFLKLRGSREDGNGAGTVVDRIEKITGISR